MLGFTIEIKYGHLVIIFTVIDLKRIKQFTFSNRNNLRGSLKKNNACRGLKNTITFIKGQINVKIQT